MGNGEEPKFDMVVGTLQSSKEVGSVTDALSHRIGAVLLRTFISHTSAFAQENRMVMQML